VEGAGTTNPAPLSNGKLCDIAPTMLAILGVPKSKEMTGRDLREPTGD